MSKVVVIDRVSGREKTMDKRFAAILVNLGRAKYKRRDMKPDPTAVDGEDQRKTEKPAAKKPAKKRTYKRRDMKPEE